MQTRFVGVGRLILAFYRKEEVMYSLYPLAFLAGFLFWAMMNYMDRDSDVKSVEVDKSL